MPNLLLLLLTALSTLFETSTTLRFENLALRQQLGVLRRSSPKHLQLTASDRLFWVWLTRVGGLAIRPDDRPAGNRRRVARERLSSLLAVEDPPWQAGPSGRVETGSRPDSDHQSSKSPWGAPRIHGELLKLGIEISEPTVYKYMVRPRKPPSRTWRTFLENHVQSLVSVDFFVVPTIRFQVL